MMKPDEKKDLNVAISELIYELKGDWSVSSLASKIGVSRNRLAAIFEVYNAKKEAGAPQKDQQCNEERTQKKLKSCDNIKKASADPEETSDDPKNKSKYKRLYWEITPLMAIADALNIRVSELIQAAEDIQDGLPPWFQYRISKNNENNAHADELRCVFFEAFGYRSYVDFELLSNKDEDKWRRKSSWYPSKNQFSDYKEAELNYFISELIDSKELEDFIQCYRTGDIKIKKAYCVVKSAVDDVTEFMRKENDGLPDVKISTSYLFMAKSELIMRIQDRYFEFCKEEERKKKQIH